MTFPRLPGPRPNRLLPGIVCGLAALLLADVARANDRDQLERELLRAAPSLLKSLREAGVGSVGVLKFRVQDGSLAPTQAAAINMRIADKLELALVLANNPHQPMLIARRASAVAARIPSVSRLDDEGREKLFERKYAPAWGKDEFTPDAFLTGLATFAPVAADKPARMTVAICWFTRTTDLRKLAKFEVDCDVEDLIDAGESFVVRGLFTKEVGPPAAAERKVDDAIAVAGAAGQVKLETGDESVPADQVRLHPLAKRNPSAPVTLEILYDGVPVPFEFRGGAAFIAEPTESQSVRLVVHRRPEIAGRLGIVLKVNGENTLFRETRPDGGCTAWVLEPGQNKLVIDGFQTQEAVAEKFRIVAQRDVGFDYGEHLGLISLSVFHERVAAPVVAAKPVKKDLDIDTEDFDILKRGLFPVRTPASFGALKSQLTLNDTRGLIVGGAKMSHSIVRTTFDRHPTPVMHGVVRYCHASALPK